jgi:hypothetical protein
MICFSLVAGYQTNTLQMKSSFVAPGTPQRNSFEFVYYLFTNFAFSTSSFLLDDIRNDNDENVFSLDHIIPKKNS